MKLKKIHIVFLIAFLVSMLGLRLWQLHWNDSGMYLKGEKINVLVADDQIKRHKGLGGRNDLGKYDGMLFIYPEAAKLGVVMRDMQFPIDVVWFYNGEVVDIAPSLQLEIGVPEKELPVYYPRIDANVFLELKAGWAKSHELQIGDKLEVVE